MATNEASENGFNARYTKPKLSTGQLHPYLVYGTAFKDGRTEKLTTTALEQGFKGLDSANYPTAYQEPQVGEAIRKAQDSGVERKDLFVQTKFTPAWAHAEGKVPFDVDQPIEEQVRQSVEQSFKNLQVDFIDALLLHVPFKDDADNLVAWRVFESFVPSRVGVLGVSNFQLPAFEKLFEAATVKPEIVQNRFHEKNGYDLTLRNFINSKGGVVYQAFSLLKANQEALASCVVARLAEAFSIQKEVAFYLLVLGLGKVSIVNGTTSEEHMQTDLQKVKELLGDQSNVGKIKSYLGEFEDLLQKIAGRP